MVMNVSGDYETAVLNLPARSSHVPEALVRRQKALRNEVEQVWVEEQNRSL